MSSPHPLMTPAEIAALFRVKMQTVARWRQEGKLTEAPTPGHRVKRYYRAEVEALMRGERLTPEQVQALADQLTDGAR